MAQVGFPGWREINRRTVKAPVNPMDKATIVSIYPFRIEERKYTLDPGVWILEPGSLDKPFCLPVGPSSWWREIDPEQPLLEIPVASVLIADSIVRDYCNGLMECNMGDTMPGLFFLPGNVNSDTVKKEYMNLLILANTKQRKWFEALVRLADVAWARSNGNPLSINELMKHAAKELGMEDREWLKAYHAVDMVRCFACGAMRNPAYPICQTCRAIDPNYKGTIKFATPSVG